MRLTLPSPLLSSHSHFHTCKYIKSKGSIDRHNLVLTCLKNIAEKAGLSCIVEPRSYVPLTKERPDLLLHGTFAPISVDVVITHPCSLTAIFTRSAHLAPCASAIAAEQRKLNNASYISAAALRGHRFIPFALEAHGALSPRARDLLKIISIHAVSNNRTLSEREFFQYAVNAISCSLQSGNAILSFNCLSACAQVRR